ncbi:ABC transporter permease subunit [Sphingomonas sinipercae]|uniref:ABC transporter permease subunit n=1 Tax=Sphingomonas sinipercae TaxID=2714944 RepID=A0A6G7ZPV3_9SPHN|nr:ABC transporter permease subunit [Sphingomonas sinipercae]QIL03001.1 ABC transporter permease subunit [Sphingomonas sinipercae]
MIPGIIRFEIRYQLRNPVFWVAAAIFLLLGFGLTASANVSIGTPGGVHKNAANAIASATAIFSLFYVFVVTAFVANAIIRDDASGFSPIVRATAVTPRQIVAGRFIGGLLIAWLGYLALPLGLLLGSSMPWVDPETVGPQVFAYYGWPLLIFALPNILFLCAALFALATLLRSMMAAYIGAIILVMGYLAVTSILAPKVEYRDAVARWDPLGAGAIERATFYWTQSELNSRLIDLSGTILFNRVWTLALAAVFLAVTFWRFTMTERAPSRRRLRKLARQERRSAVAAAVAPVLGGERVTASDLTPSRSTQFLTRLRVEVRQVLTSPGLIVLLLLSVVFTGISLWLSQSRYGTSDFPTVAATISNVEGGSGLFLLMIAAFFGGELVWRERDRKLNELIDSTAAPSWIITVPKILAIFLVLLLVNLAGALTGIVYQLTEGAKVIGLSDYVTWLIVPVALDALLIAVLAVFVQVLSPNKYVGWGILFVWFVSGIFLNNLGYGNPLYTYGRTPQVPLSDFVGAGSFWIGAWVLRMYWFFFAVVLAVLAHLLWPRGTDLAVRARVRRLPRMASTPALVIVGIAGVLMAATGAYAYYNMKVLNRYQTSDEAEKFVADYERKYLKYEKLPQPAVTKVALDVQLYPKQKMLVTDGAYALVNTGTTPISDIHVRKSDQDAEWLKLDIAGAKLASDDEKFGYRIYRLAKPLAPGASTMLRFKSRIWHRGFRAGSPATDVIENGTFANNFDFAPVIGMDRTSLLRDRIKRRRQGLPAELRTAKLEDMNGARRSYFGVSWVMSDITVTTDADQTPIAPGNQVSDTVKDGRRTARFVSPAPILNFFSIQSARYKVATLNHNGLKLSVYYHPDHDWNVDKMLKAMAKSLDYYRANFGPYQFNYARIIEFPGYRSFAQAFAGTMPYSESIGFNANTNDPDKIDFTTYVVAHEMGHQYWAHQVVGGDMQGATSMSETLAQYSALMTMKQIYGPDKIRRFLKYELDNYLRSRAGEAVEELPLERVENQDYIHYRKGALAMYLLQERLGEDAVNRALSRFLDAWRFKGPPYPRSLDMIAEFRKEAKTPEQQRLISDLFSKITVYDLKVVDAKTRHSGDGWTTTLTLAGEKAYANGKGEETKAKLDEQVEIGLFTARPGLGAFSAKDVIVIERQRLHNGNQQVVVKSKVKPAFAGVDPYNFFIDRNSDDNVKAVTAS